MNRKWEKGDFISVEFPMDPVYVKAGAVLQEYENKAAVMRGPVLYLAEGIDNHAGYYQAELTGGKLAVKNSKLFGECKLIEVECLIDGNRETLVFLPYYAFDNRGSDSFRIWFDKERV